MSIVLYVMLSSTLLLKYTRRLVAILYYIKCIIIAIRGIRLQLRCGNIGLANCDNRHFRIGIKCGEKKKDIRTNSYESTTNVTKPSYIAAQ